MKTKKNLLEITEVLGKTAFIILFFIIFLTCLSACTKKKSESDTAKLPDWKTEVDAHLSGFGHRNWILIVDKAFPAQNTNGLITIDTKENLQEALLYTLQHIAKSTHIKPIVYTDKEFAYLNSKQVSQIVEYRNLRTDILQKYNPQVLLHDSVFVKINQASKLFKVLVLKTNEVIPYSSVFIELDCKYWSPEKEKTLRENMK